MQSSFLSGSIVLLLAALGVSSCSSPAREKEKATTSIAPSTEKLTAKPASQPCQLKSFTQAYGPGKRVFSFAYQGDKLQHAEVKADGQQAGQQVRYTYNTKGRADSILATPGKSFLKYIYDEQGKLVKIEAGGSYMPRTFSYNDQGQISRQETFFNGKPWAATEYRYDAQGNPVEANIYDQSGKREQTVIFRYDEKSNPMKNTGALVNALEMLYGYPVANSVHNLTEVTTTYHKNPGYRVDGEEIKEGTKLTKALAYHYNGQEYPTSLNTQKAATSWEYTCQ